MSAQLAVCVDCVHVFHSVQVLASPHRLHGRDHYVPSPTLLQSVAAVVMSQAAYADDQQLCSALRHLNAERVAAALLIATTLGAHEQQALHQACIVIKLAARGSCKCCRDGRGHDTEFVH